MRAIASLSPPANRTAGLADDRLHHVDFVLDGRIARQMPIKEDAEREHYVEGFRRAGLD